MSAKPTTREQQEPELENTDSETESGPLADRYPINQPDEFERVADGDRDPTLPDHLIEITNPNQTAVCDVCGNWVKVGFDGTEYGHRQPCEHRPSCVETWCQRIDGGDSA